MAVALLDAVFILFGTAWCQAADRLLNTVLAVSGAKLYTAVLWPVLSLPVAKTTVSGGSGP